MIIAVDGPAGAGKSTAAKLIARKLRFLYIDTGAMYRALTLKALQQKIDTKDTARIVELAKKSLVGLENDSQTGALKVFLDGKDVSREIRQPVITQFVSDIAKIKGVREVMSGLQRKLAEKRDAVLDGRDIGTVVFPDADRKFYIDAKFSERVNRRFKELKSLGEDVTVSIVDSDLRNRDTIDSNREVAPLRKADDAIYIDTTDMSIEEVVERMLKEISG